MKQKIGTALYPFVIAVCITILIIGVAGIAIRALVSEGFLKLLEEIYD